MIDSETLEKRNADFIKTCRARGLKATHQRMEIYREVAGSEEHPDAETIYRRVRERIPSISLDTVYRTLRMMEDMNIISRVGFLKDRARFDGNSRPHHHFVCERCGMVRDFYSQAVERMKIPSEISRMGSVNFKYLELRGVCNRCREKESEEM